MRGRPGRWSAAEGLRPTQTGMGPGSAPGGRASAAESSVEAFVARAVPRVDSLLAREQAQSFTLQVLESLGSPCRLPVLFQVAPSLLFLELLYQKQQERLAPSGGVLLGKLVPQVRIALGVFPVFWLIAGTRFSVLSLIF